MANMRAKMKITAVNRNEYGENLEFTAVCKKESYGDEGLDENNTYATFTPAASLTMTINNPALLGKFNPGEEYYLDFTKAE